MHVLVALLAVFVMQCFIAVHTLWPNYPYLSLVFLWAAVVPARRRRLRRVAGLTLGIVLGEAAGYFLAVPPALTWVCLLRNEYVVPITMVLRLFSVLLALWAWVVIRRGTPPVSPRWRATAGDAGWVAIGLLLILPFAWVSGERLLGHRPYYERVAEVRARAALGRDYADYDYFVRRLDLVFRTGESVTARASLLAYSTDLRDIQDVAVSWKEPWTH